MGLFGGGVDLQMEHERKKAQMLLRAAKSKYRKAGSDNTDPAGFDKYAEGDVKEARLRYDRENPSRFRRLWRLGEVFSRWF